MRKIVDVIEVGNEQALSGGGARRNRQSRRRSCSDTIPLVKRKRARAEDVFETVRCRAVRDRGPWHAQRGNVSVPVVGSNGVRLTSTNSTHSANRQADVTSVGAGR